MNKKTDNLVHIRFEYDLALKTKRDIISSELDLVRIIKILQRYKALRIEELKIKAMLIRRLRTLKIDLGALQALLPGTRAEKLVKDIYEEYGPESAKKMEKEILTSTKPTKVTPEKTEQEDDLESQLAGIQKRLASISS